MRVLLVEDEPNAARVLSKGLREQALTLRARVTIWYSFALLAVLSSFAIVVVWQQGRIQLK